MHFNALEYNVWIGEAAQLFLFNSLRLFCERVALSLSFFFSFSFFPLAECL